MSEDKSSSIGTMIVVAIAAGLIGYVVGKPTATQKQANNDPAESEEAALLKEEIDRLKIKITALETDNNESATPEKPKGPPVEGAVKWNGHWYAFIVDPLSWSEAKARCKQYGGHLIIINSEEENEFAWKMANEQGKRQAKIWLGASDPQGDRVFKWGPPNGKRLSETFNKWSGDAFIHKGDTEKGVEMTVIGPDPNRVKKWDFVTAKGVKSPFICEWE